MEVFKNKINKKKNPKRHIEHLNTVQLFYFSPEGTHLGDKPSLAPSTSGNINIKGMGITGTNYTSKLFRQTCLFEISVF